MTVDTALYTLRTARLNAGMSPEQLSERSGISLSTIYRLENGGGGFSTTVDVAHSLADALEVDYKAIAWPYGLSSLRGRAKCKSKRTTPVEENPRSGLCTIHFIKLSLRGQCDDCIA
jgi:transcriptional regulator with XRE-family HTH domain